MVNRYGTTVQSSVVDPNQEPEDRASIINWLTGSKSGAVINYVITDPVTDPGPDPTIYQRFKKDSTFYNIS